MDQKQKIDDYIKKAQPFAQPILKHLREMIHKGCPGVVETMKWSMPFFVYRDEILCNMSAFKAHCNFGFWGKEIGAVLREEKVVQENGMSAFGRITSVKDLPADKRMVGWIKQAAALIDGGQYTSPMAGRGRTVKPAVVAPDEFAAALQKNKKAAAVFAAFSASCKREYVEWIADTKRAETRDKRIATAVEWIAEGKQRNWKYQNC